MLNLLNPDYHVQRAYWFFQDNRKCPAKLQNGRRPLTSESYGLQCTLSTRSTSVPGRAFRNHSKSVSRPRMQTALILGATGLIGRAIFNQLLTDSTYSKIIVLARRPQAVTHTKVEWRVVDFDAPATYEALKKDQIDAVFCALGTTRKQTPNLEQYRKIDHDYPVNVAKATAPKAVYCLVSAVGANPKSSVFYTKLKGEVEAHVAEAGPASFYAFRPSFLIGEREGSRAVENLFAGVFRGVGFMFQGPFSHYHAIAGTQVAAAMIRAAKEKAPGTHIHHYKEMC